MKNGNKQFYIFRIIFYVLFLFSITYSNAAGIMGSDLTWTCVGKDSFMVKLILIADCNQEPPGNQMLSCYCTNGGSLIKTISLNNPIPVDITPTCTNSCTRCQDAQCTFPYGIHQYNYHKLITLTEAGSCCEIRISLTTCCWDSALTTIVNPGDKNFYTEAILNRCTNPCDNSPSFVQTLSAIVCHQTDFVYSNGVIDIDITPQGGLLDSLCYEFCPPLSSKDTAIEYNLPYSYSIPADFFGFPNTSLPFPRGFHLDPNTGSVAFRPARFQQSVMTVKVTEYRDGIKIGEVRRNIYLIVIYCPENNPPKIGPSIYSKEICAGQPVTFTINSNDMDPIDTLTLSWNHGIAGASWSDNNGKAKHPTGIFSWIPGESQASTLPYTFTVTVKDANCPVSGQFTQTYQVFVKPIPRAAITVTDSGCGIYWFNARPIQGKDASFYWLGNSFNFTPPNVRTTQLRFLQKGKYPYLLTVSAESCEKVYHDTIFVTQDADLADVDLGNDTTINHNDFLHLDAGPGFKKYLWNDGTTSQTCLFDASKHGTNDQYVWVMVTDSNNCLAYDSIEITVRNQLNTADNLLNKTRIYPVPAHDMLNIDVQYGISEITLTDIMGKTILHKTVSPGINSINVSNLAEGSYFLRINRECFLVLIK